MLGLQSLATRFESIVLLFLVGRDAAKPTQLNSQYLVAPLLLFFPRVTVAYGQANQVQWLPLSALQCRLHV